MTKVGIGTTNPTARLFIYSRPFYATLADLNNICEVITNMIKKLLQDEIGEINGHGQRWNNFASSSSTVFAAPGVPATMPATMPATNTKNLTVPISAEEFKKALDPILAMLTLLYDELQELKKKEEDN